jgi:hypothetical protein
MPSKFTLLEGDQSGIPSTYYRRSQDHLYDVYEINFWKDLDSSAIATHGTYNVQAGTVDLEQADVAVQALKSCGWELHPEHGIWAPFSGDIIAAVGSKHWDAVLVSALWGYGAKDVTADVSGNNLRALIRQARASL